MFKDLRKKERKKERKGKEENERKEYRNIEARILRNSSKIEEENYRKGGSVCIRNLPSAKEESVVCAYRIYPGKKKQWRRWLIHSISDSWMLD